MRRFLLTLLLVALAAPALASDGILEINQTCAESPSGCFSGDTAGFPVTIATPGSYHLTGNLQVTSANTTAVEITTGVVTLDLAGFAILGITTCSGVPISICGPLGNGRGVSGLQGASDIVVRNGTISGMGNAGVVLDFSVRAEGLHVFKNGGNGLVLGNESIAWRNIVTSNGSDGIRCGRHCVIRDNTSTGNRIEGIELVSGTVIGNTSTRNGGLGGKFGTLTSYSQNMFSGNLAGDVSGGHGTSGNACGDGSCSRVPRRRYFLSSGALVGGFEAGAACGAGFHVASLWELLGLASLEYDTSRGVTSNAGSGPPSSVGWAYTSDSGGDCVDWTSTSFASGTFIRLTDDPVDQDVGPWEIGSSVCDGSVVTRTWCIED
jgi:hypothetical protein